MLRGMARVCLAKNRGAAKRPSSPVSRAVMLIAVAVIVFSAGVAPSLEGQGHLKNKRTRGGKPKRTEPAKAGAASSGYRVLKTISLGGEGGWDYLTMDSAARRLYISRGTHTMVVDADSGTVAGDIPDTKGVHGIALASDLGRGFTSNGQAASVTIFDLKTLKVLGTAKTGERPDAILYDPATKRIFTFNAGSQNATAIDAASGDVVGEIPVGGKPEFAVADGAGTIFVNVEDKAEIVAIDSKDLKELHRWKLAGCEEPSGLAMDIKNRRLFSTCGNKVMSVVDADSGSVVATVPIGSGTDAAEFDADQALVFSSNGEGNLTVIHEDSPGKFSVVQNVPTKRGARTMALDKKTHSIYLATAEFEPLPEGQKGRPKMAPNSFQLLVVGK